MTEKTYTVKIIPNSKTNKIIKESADFLKIKITAPAIDNKANKALLAFLAKKYNISKSNIKIIKGLKNRNKTIQIISE